MFFICEMSLNVTFRSNVFIIFLIYKIQWPFVGLLFWGWKKQNINDSFFCVRLVMGSSCTSNIVCRPIDGLQNMYDSFESWIFCGPSARCSINSKPIWYPAGPYIHMDSVFFLSNFLCVLFFKVNWSVWTYYNSNLTIGSKLLFIKNTFLFWICDWVVYCVS